MNVSHYDRALLNAAELQAMGDAKDTPNRDGEIVCDA